MEITLFTKCLFEFIGTLVLVLLGDGVVASTVLKLSLIHISEPTRRS